jgi:hypothetical protein
MGSSLAARTLPLSEEEFFHTLKALGVAKYGGHGKKFCRKSCAFLHLEAK